jgi:hypothetical protein
MIQTEQIRTHMQVVGNDGELVGMVDSVEADELRLTKTSAPDGKHHFLPLETVEFVDDRVHLNRTSNRAMAEWR